MSLKKRGITRINSIFYDNMEFKNALMSKEILQEINTKRNTPVFEVDKNVFENKEVVLKDLEEEIKLTQFVITLKEVVSKSKTKNKL